VKQAVTIWVGVLLFAIALIGGIILLTKNNAHVLGIATKSLLARLYDPTGNYDPGDNSIASRRQFPLGMYVSNPSASDLQQLGNLGVNLIYDSDNISNFNDADYQHVKNLLDTANQNHIAVIINMFYPLVDQSLLSRLPAFMAKIMYHPALYGYYIMDEPESFSWVNPTSFKRLNDTIKRIDSRHYTVTVFAGFDLYKARSYAGITDIEGFDIYPFSYNAQTTQYQQNAYSRELQTFLSLPMGQTKAYFIIPQANQSYPLNLRTPSQPELDQFIQKSLSVSSLFQGFLSFAWRSSDWRTNGLENLSDLQTSFRNIHSEYKNRFSSVPVVYPQCTYLYSYTKCNGTYQQTWYHYNYCPDAQKGNSQIAGQCGYRPPTPTPRNRNRRYLY